MSVWAYRVYYKHKKKVFARSEQFRTKKQAKILAERSLWLGKIEIRKERKTKLQKKEEKIIKKLGLRNGKKELTAEQVIPL